MVAHHDEICLISFLLVCFILRMSDIKSVDSKSLQVVRYL